MAATKYLDYDGLLYLWTLMKGKLNLKADKATTLAGYGITDAKINNGVITLGGNSITPLTSISNSNLPDSGIATGVYKSVTVNSKGIVTSGSNPTTLSGYGITDAYTKSEIDTKLTSAMRYKGSVATVSDLPSTDNVVGDFYNVTATGENYAWTGTEWDITGNIIDLQSITNTEIDTIVAS